MKSLDPTGPVRAGRFLLLAELGRGGMGRVYLGAGPDGRLVAVKLVHASLVNEEGYRARFRREAAASAKVSGAYTAAVVGANPDATVPWLASVYVPAPTLEEAVAACGGLPETAVIRLATGLAAALEEIHRAGLVHRDLKPSNVLLAEDGPKVIDFGIARTADHGGGTEITRAGALIGSPAFMSPEHAQGLPVTPASDMFSLGVLLVAAITGASPFAGPGTPQTLYNIVYTEPDLSRVPPGVRRIVASCLAKDPANRPTPAKVMDQAGHVAPSAHPWPSAIHELIDARRAEPDRFLIMHRSEQAVMNVLAAPAADAFLTGDTITGGTNEHDAFAYNMAADSTVSQAIPIAAPHSAPLPAHRDAPAHRAPAERRWRLSRRTLLASGVIAAAAIAFPAALELPGASSQPPSAGSQRQRASSKTPARAVTKRPAVKVTDTVTTDMTATSIAFGSGGRFLACANNGIVVLSTATFSQSTSFSPMGKLIESAAFSPGKTSRFLAGGNRSGGVYVLNPVTESSITLDSDSVVAVAFSPDGRTLVAATVTNDSKLRYPIWSVPDFRLLRVLTSESLSGQSGCLAFSQDGRFLATGGDVRDTASYKVIGTIDPEDSFASIEFSPDGKFLATADEMGVINLWNASSFAELNAFSMYDEFEDGPSTGGCVAFSPDGTMLASSDASNYVKLWDPATGALLATFDKLNGDVLALAFGRLPGTGGQMLACSTGEDTGSITAWTIRAT
jgi:eukaryotic-like serine/threonine-protein kinase